MSRVAVLYKINELENEHETATRKRQKEIDKEILSLGTLLKLPKKRLKIDAPLSKGKDLTFSEIEWLLEQNVMKKEIFEALDMNKNAFYKYLKLNGVSVGYTDNRNKLEARRLLKETNKSIPEIIKETGTKRSTVYAYAREIRMAKRALEVEVQSPHGQWF